MASIISYDSINFFDHGWVAEVTDWTSEQINIDYPDGSGINWVEAKGRWHGTGTYYAEYDRYGDTTLEISDFAAPLALFQYDWTTIFSELLSGPDTIALFGVSDDTVFSGGGNDIIFSYRGSKYIDGGAGIDTAVYELGRANYSVQLSSDGIYVQGAGSYDLLVNVERVAFSNEGLLAWDANATQMYRLYQAAFDRTPDTAGLSYWVLQADEGLSLYQAAQGFFASPEFVSAYGSAPSNTEFVQLLYQNVLGRTASTGEQGYWTDAMLAGKAHGELLVDFSESAENVSNTASVISDGIWLI
jgi:hypothetical protein